MDPISSAFLSVFWFLVVITVVVFIHEFGHYIIARINGVRVEIFSIGFGTELFGYTDPYGTRWKISAIPMGGYVKMFGDADPASSPDFKGIKKMSKMDKEHSFYFKSLWQKAAIVLAGPAANYISAIIILAVMFNISGKAYIIPEVTAVVKDSAADKAGIKSGDLIIQLDDEPINSFEDIKQTMALNVGNDVSVVVLRKGKELTFNLHPEHKITKDVFGNEIKMYMLGISSSKYETQVLSFSESLIEAMKDAYNISEGMLTAVGQILTGARSTDDLGGPVKIAKYSGQSAEAGIYGILWFIALISINLGLVNLFPIPMLDGGHLMFYAIEALKGKPLSEKIQMVLFRIGGALLVLLMLYVTFKDIASLVH